MLTYVARILRVLLPLPGVTAALVLSVAPVLAPTTATAAPDPLWNNFTKDAKSFDSDAQTTKADVRVVFSYPSPWVFHNTDIPPGGSQQAGYQFHLPDDGFIGISIKKKDVTVTDDASALEAIIKTMPPGKMSDVKDIKVSGYPAKRLTGIPEQQMLRYMYLISCNKTLLIIICGIKKDGRTPEEAAAFMDKVVGGMKLTPH